MKIAFVLQYYPYQYDQFYSLITYLDADPYYRINTTRRSTYCNSKIFSINNDKLVGFDEFKSNKYDILIYTGPNCKSLYKFSELCTCSKIILLSHSLIGSLYDISIATPCDGMSVGIIPELWTKFDSFAKRITTVNDEHGTMSYILTKSHPMVASVTEHKPTVEVENSSLGVIFGEKSPFEHFSIIIDNLVDKFKFDKVKIKFHPLCYGRQDLVEMFSNRGYNTEILPIEFDKYEWLDSCKYIIGGCSSLLIEEMIRSKYYSLSQKFKQFPFKRRGISLDIEEYDTDHWSDEDPKFTKLLNYDSLLEVKQILLDIVGGYHG